MGYYLPLKFFNVGNNAAICATRVVAIMSTKVHQAREMLKAEKRAKTLINAAGRDRVQSIVLLDNGAVIASPRSVQVLLNAIAKANSKRVDVGIKGSQTITVYDQQEPDPLYDEDEPEVLIDAEDFEDEGDADEGD